MKPETKFYVNVKKNIRFLPEKYNKILYIKILLTRKVIEGISENIIKKTLFLKANSLFKNYDIKELINIVED